MNAIKKRIEIIDNAATGKGVRIFRLNKGVGLRSVARAMGISAPYLSDLELGRRNWTEALLNRVRKAIKQIAK